MFKFIKKVKANRRARRLASENPAETFTRYYRDNTWGDKESASGKGSNLAVTEQLRAQLPSLLRDLGAQSILDVPCGDFNWMAQVDLRGIAYVGGDIVPDLIASNSVKFARDDRAFEVINLIDSPLPDCDLIFTRDCLVHLCFADATSAINNIRNSNATWLLATTFPQTTENAEIQTGDWRRLDMTKPPFNFPEPQRMIDEQLASKDGRHSDKSMGLWRISDLPDPDVEA